MYGVLLVSLVCELGDTGHAVVLSWSVLVLARSLLDLNFSLSSASLTWYCSSVIVFPIVSSLSTTLELSFGASLYLRVLFTRL